VPGLRSTPSAWRRRRERAGRRRAEVVTMDAATLVLPLWSVVPFVLLLLAIAVLPLLAPHFWHANRNKGLVAGLFAVPVAAYLIALGPATDGQSTHALVHELEQYVS